MNIQDKLTNKAQEALVGAQIIAQERNNQSVDCIHLLFSLIDKDELIEDIRGVYNE